MICPKCRNYNDDRAKFCRKCGSPLIHQQNNVTVNPQPQESFFEKNKLLIVAIVIVAIVALVIGAFAYSSVNHETPVSQSANQSLPVESTSGEDSSPSTSSSPTTTATPTSTATASSNSAPLKIQGGHFYTGTELEDKTYAKFYVGPEHGGESIYVQIFYSRDGNALNNGNMVPVTVSSGGFVKVTSADAYSFYPDHATIKVYDANQNLQDTLSVSLSPTSGTQNF